MTLPITSVSSQGGQNGPSRESKDTATRAHYERLWMLNAEQFNPELTAMGRARIERTWQLLEPLVKDKTNAVDLAFGWGTLMRKLMARGVNVSGLDVASNALKRFKDEGAVELKRETLPNTTFKDSEYDLVVCTDVIADMHSYDQRLLISEIYRLMKKEGHFVCSTPLDIDTEGALERFIALVETELQIDHIVISYNALFIKLLRLAGRISHRLAQKLTQSDRTLSRLEKICRQIMPDDGVSHVIVSGKRKPLTESAETNKSTMNPQRQRLRERVWE